MTADPTLLAALAADGAWVFCAVQIDLPGGSLRVLDGSGVINIGGYDFAGYDADFGMIAACEPIEESADNQAPEVRLVFNPSDTVAAVTLANPAMQGSRVSIMIGCYDPSTATAIGTPEVVFLGEIDVATLRIGDKSRQVEFTIVSVFERLFAVDEGERATDGFHQSIWPGETGLQFMTGTEEKLYWGANAPAGATGGSASITYDRGGASRAYSNG